MFDILLSEYKGERDAHPELHGASADLARFEAPSLDCIHGWNVKTGMVGFLDLRILNATILIHDDEDIDRPLYFLLF